MAAAETSEEEGGAAESSQYVKEVNHSLLKWSSLSEIAVWARDTLSHSGTKQSPSDALSDAGKWGLLTSSRKGRMQTI